MHTRFFAALLAACSLVAAAPAAAESAVHLAPLARGEVLLEVAGGGVIRTPASAATITTSAYGYGGNAQEAQRRLAQDTERLRSAAAAAGATPADIRVEPVAVTDEIRMRAMVERMEAGTAEGGDGFADAASRITIRLRNPALAAELNARLNDLPAETFGRLTPPVYEIADPVSARRQARSAALEQARADADAYAEALGMRVVRTLRVTDREGFDFLGLLLTDQAALDYVSGLEPSYYRPGPRRAEVATAAVVGVDYVLAPR
jgi:uncharacterized protein YggE